MADVKKHRGRPQIGTSKVVKLTMPDELWYAVDCMLHESDKTSERLRDIVKFYFDYQGRMRKNLEKKGGSM